ncbi:cupin domain-containing protein [Tumidithrix elongata RA019]|uniref:Cupin domain-containing protein n=1 Tax=Tumidithrix elongata BACA0141 TaxID=2716417 RepID=A0AAW9PYH4_9CYAN|nr:cupin domain-containing protein [Tumidithrix elongata RA019]
MANIFNLPQESIPLELFEALASGDDILIERIISSGQITPEGQWYDQTTDEWVILLQGEAEIAYLDGSRQQLRAGDHILIPAHHKHRVAYTSIEPACIWLAVHGRMQAA